MNSRRKKYLLPVELPIHQNIAVNILLTLLLSMTTEAENTQNTTSPSIFEVCPRGLFLLDRPAKGPSTPYLTPASSRTCVTVCPLGFYSSIKFKNKPSFADLHSGHPGRQAALLCLPCPSQCTACLGPKSCFVCDAQWIRKHSAAFQHESKADQEKLLISSRNDCHTWEKIVARDRKLIYSEKSNKSLGTVALMVALAAMFSAILVFSLYRLHWERRQGSRGSNGPSICRSSWDWITGCWERKKYSAITSDERAMWSKTEETTIFRDVEFRDGTGDTSTSRSETGVVQAGDSDFDN